MNEQGTKNEDDARSNLEQSNLSCPECESLNIRNNGQGELVCVNCGIVIQERMIDDGKFWRTFTASEYESRVHHEIKDPTGRLFTRTSRISSEDKDISGKMLSGITKETMHRLRRHDRYVEKDERSLNTAENELVRLQSLIHFSDSIKKTVVFLFKKFRKKKSVQGYSMRMILCALVYISTRIHKQYFTYDYIARLAYGGISSRDHALKISAVVGKVKKILKLRLPMIDPRILLEKTASDLEFSRATTNDAHELLEKIKEAGLHDGKKPSGMIGAILYITAILNKENKTQRAIADSCHVTEVTIRNRYKEIVQKLNIDLN